MKRNLSILAVLLSLMILTPIDLHAQQWTKANASSNADQIGGFIKTTAIYLLMILGIIGTSITGYKLYMSPDKTIELVAGFLISVIIIFGCIGYFN